MIANETKKRLAIGALILILLTGAIFGFWKWYLNHAVISIQAKSPYAVTVGSKNFQCKTDQCHIDTIPGKHHLTLKKEGYSDENRDIQLSLNGHYDENINFRFMPVFKKIANPDFFQFAADLPEKQNQKLAQELKNIAAPVFYDPSGNYIYYIARNKNNFRQSLFSQQIGTDDHLKDPAIITTFIRDIDKYFLRISPARDKILLIDQTDGISTLYLIDAVLKNRLNLMSFPLIRAAAWFADGKDFLLEVREANSPLFSLYDIQGDTATPEKLDLNAALQNVAIANNNTLIAAVQNEDAAQSAATGAQISFVEYTIPLKQTRVIKTLEGTLSDKVELDKEQKFLYFLRQNELLALQLKE